jgi:hypothetical protein
VNHTETCDLPVHTWTESIEVGLQGIQIGRDVWADGVPKKGKGHGGKAALASGLIGTKHLDKQI